jgi:putative endonuclease
MLSAMRDQRLYYVYMMQSSSRRALYIGVTGDLEHRVWQHKRGEFDGFSADYKTHRLVYYERFADVTNAITREKQLKNWRRSKKEWLVRTMNPEWKDLSADWFKHHRYEPAEELDRATGLANTRSLDSRGKTGPARSG